MNNDNQKINDCQDELILKDIKSGKRVQWKEKKLANIELSKLFSYIAFKDGNPYYENKYLRIKNCSDILLFKRYSDNTLKFHSAAFCKIRLCPICSWRRSLKIFGQVSKVMDYIQNVNPSRRYIFLTLTVKNCNGAELDNTIKFMFNSFHKLMRRKRVKDSIKGFFRALEVTYNMNDNTYHPHIHCVFMVESNYFYSDKYINQLEWTSLWKDCLKIDYIPQVDIRVCNKTINENGQTIDDYSKSIAEIAKYSVKSKDYIFNLINDYDRNNNDKYKKLVSLTPDQELDLNSEVVKVLDYALSNKRLFAFGYEFKEIHKLLNLDDIIDGDLIDTDIEDSSINPDLSFVIETYKWNIGLGNYVRFNL